MVNIGIRTKVGHAEEPRDVQYLINSNLLRNMMNLSSYPRDHPKQLYGERLSWTISWKSPRLGSLVGENGHGAYKTLRVGDIHYLV